MTYDSRDHVQGSIDISAIDRSTYEYGPEPYKDPQVLRTLYHGNELSQGEIADYCGVSQATICDWLDKFDIDTRPPMDKRNRSISKSHGIKNRVQFHIPDGDSKYVSLYRHQLVVLLSEAITGNWEYTARDVFDGEVHHEMCAPVAIDIACNLAVYSRREHAQLHGSGGSSLIEWVETTLEEMFDGYDGEPDPDDVPIPDEFWEAIDEDPDDYPSLGPAQSTHAAPADD